MKFSLTLFWSFVIFQILGFSQIFDEDFIRDQKFVSRDNDQVLVVDEDGNGRLYKLNNSALELIQKLIGNQDELTALFKVLGKNKYLGISEEELLIYDSNDNLPISRFELDLEYFSEIFSSPDSSCIVLVSRKDQSSKAKIYLLNTISNDLVFTEEISAGLFSFFDIYYKFSKNSKYFACAYNSNIEIWDVKSGIILGSKELDLNLLSSLRGIEFNYSNTALVSWSFGEIQFLKLPNLALRWKYDFRVPDYCIFDLDDQMLLIRNPSEYKFLRTKDASLISSNDLEMENWIVGQIRTPISVKFSQNYDSVSILCYASNSTELLVYGRGGLINETFNLPQVGKWLPEVELIKHPTIDDPKITFNFLLRKYYDDTKSYGQAQRFGKVNFSIEGINREFVSDDSGRVRLSITEDLKFSEFDNPDSIEIKIIFPEYNSSSFLKLDPKNWTKEYFQIEQEKVKVLNEDNGELKVLGSLSKGEKYPILFYSAEMVKIDFQGKEGFVTPKSGKIIYRAFK